MFLRPSSWSLLPTRAALPGPPIRGQDQALRSSSQERVVLAVQENEKHWRCVFLALTWKLPENTFPRRRKWVRNGAGCAQTRCGLFWPTATKKQICNRWVRGLKGGRSSCCGVAVLIISSSASNEASSSTRIPSQQKPARGCSLWETAWRSG